MKRPPPQQRMNQIIAKNIERCDKVKTGQLPNGSLYVLTTRHGRSRYFVRVKGYWHERKPR